MSIPVYTDFIIKYSHEKTYERDPFSVSSALSDATYYDIFQKSRLIDVSEMLSSLYEDQLISYIRTDSSLMSIEQFDERFSIFDSIADSFFDDPLIMRLLMKIDINLMKEGYWIDGSKLQHHAITPLASHVNLNTHFNISRRPYEEIRKSMYLDICKAYINLFIPD